MTKNITFSLPAEAVEGASEAILLGDFNNWNPEKAPKLEKQADGSYKTVAQLEEGKTYHYRFLLDNGKWVNDYHAQKYETAPGLYVDNCVITVPKSVKENKKEQATASKTANTKVVKAQSSATEITSEKQESSKTKAPKKAKAKTEKEEAPKTKKAKAVNAKVVGEKTEKPAKTTKKATPKEIK
ncbi:MAG: isoamylase early set domain-containing protein [Ginsengibacter sp.]